MDQKQEFIQNYEEKYKKISRVRLGILILCFIYILIGFYCIFNNKSITLLSVLFLAAAFMITRICNLETGRNIKRIVDKWADDFDTEFAISIYQELLKDKKRKDYWQLLGSYLNLLLILCRFDEFETVYQANKKVMQKKMAAYLMYFRECFAALLPDRSYLKTLLSKHKYSKYHKVQGELAERKAALRMQDENYEVLLLYENQEYQKAIDKIEQMHLNSRYNRLVFEMMKERCLCRLNENYVLPELDDPEFLCVKRLKYLAEANEEFQYERAKDILTYIEQDLQKCQKYVKKIRIFFLVCLCVVAGGVSFFALNHDERGEEKLISDLKTWDIEAELLYGFCENDDISAAIMWGKLSESDMFSGYYLIGIDYYKDGLIPMMKADYEVIGFNLDENRIYTYAGENSTYVVMTAEDNMQIIYDGKMIEAYQDELPLIDGQKQKIVYFVVDGMFDVDKLELTEEWIKL